MCPWTWQTAQSKKEAGKLGLILPRDILVGTFHHFYSILIVLHTTSSQTFIFNRSYCWNFSNNSAQQNTKKDNMSWFMNKTTKPDSPINGYGMTYELQNYCLFCCMMPQLCDSQWLRSPPTWTSILDLKSMFFSPPQNHKTSELKMGLRHTIAHHPQTAPPPAVIL